MAHEYDVVVVGSGPNGLAAAITLQLEGLSVLLVEGKETIGGGMRTAELTLPGFKHDICSAIHPMGMASPFFQKLPLQQHGLEFVLPPIAAAHPFDDGSAAVLEGDLLKTASLLGVDKDAYISLFQHLVHHWPSLAPDVLGPLTIPRNPIGLARFGWKALPSANWMVSRFKTKEARGLWAGMAAHSLQPLSNLTTSAIALVLMAVGHKFNWPIPKGGSQSIANALASYFVFLGGRIETGFYVDKLEKLPSAKAVLLDVTPYQLLEIAGHKLSSIYKWQLNKYRYGMGVYKVDWAIEGQIPFTAEKCRRAGTVHIGNTFEEIAAGERMIWKGQHPEKPFVLLAQQSNFDLSRAPEGKNTVWAYCHVPNGSKVDMTTAIENQIERFAPGFRERILAKHVFSPLSMQEYNPNYFGGDINGGSLDIRQLFTRPALRYSPYRTSMKGLYICSSSTPPGGGVHGMCGYHAAKRALKDVFKINTSLDL